MENTTIKGFLKYWLDSVMRGSIRQSSYMAYRGYIENHINPSIGTEELPAVKVERLQAFIGELTEKGLASKTVRSIMLMLRGALECAVDYEYIIKNPCDKVRLPRLEEKEVIVFDEADQKRLENTVMHGGDKRYFGILICLYTGLRIGELCGLKWESVNFAQSTIEIKSSLNRVITYDGGAKKTAVVEVAPKTKKSRRTIPLPQFLCDLLKKLRERSNSDYVVSMKDGKAVEPRMMQIVYTKLLNEAGVAYAGFHTLRHTFTTRAIEFGVDVKTISEILGHSNTMITVNRYAHSLFEQKRKMMERFNHFFGQTVQTQIFSSGIS
jgi:integrase